jgi:L,D-transpeptidase YcbB
MTKLQLACAIALCGMIPCYAAGHQSTWSEQQIEILRAQLDIARAEGLELGETTPLSPTTATAIALRLARAHLFGHSAASARSGWRIASGDERYDLELQLGDALARDDLTAFFARLRPRHPDYPALVAALKTEADPARRAVINLNLDRWRWMPLELGSHYLLVNAPRFEVGLWQDGRQIGSWRIIVGKPSTPTPVFAATVTGVTYNPWWDVPQSIVRESVGRLTRISPAEARRRGFVWGGGSYRQRPGPNNPLGQMKLVMPNPYSVYLHDTNNKTLFDQPVRTFSHGCIRVDNALGLAAALLGSDRFAEAGRRTIKFATPRPVPVYVTYFTASVGPTGHVEFHPDIYGRDVRLTLVANEPPDCPA